MGKESEIAEGVGKGDQKSLEIHPRVNKLKKKVKRFRRKCTQLEIENQALLQSNEWLRRYRDRLVVRKQLLVKQTQFWHDELDHLAQRYQALETKYSQRKHAERQLDHPRQDISLHFTVIFNYLMLLIASQLLEVIINIFICFTDDTMGDEAMMTISVGHLDQF